MLDSPSTHARRRVVADMSCRRHRTGARGWGASGSTIALRRPSSPSKAFSRTARTGASRAHVRITAPTGQPRRRARAADYPLSHPRCRRIDRLLGCKSGSAAEPPTPPTLPVDDVLARERSEIASLRELVGDGRDRSEAGREIGQRMGAIRAREVARAHGTAALRRRANLKWSAALERPIRRTAREVRGRIATTVSKAWSASTARTAVQRIR